MTHSHDNNNSDRLSRIENLVESNSRAIQALIEQRGSEQLQHEQAMASIRAVTDSNARSIQAIIEQQTTDRLNHQERMLQHEARMRSLEENLVETRQLMAQVTETQRGLTKILINHDQDRPSILRSLMTIENKVDQLLDRNPE